MPDKDQNLQNTNYHGAVISNKMAAALKKTPAGEELFRFEKRGGRTVLPSKRFCVQPVMKKSEKSCKREISVNWPC